MLTKKTRYAIMALVVLAREYEKEPVAISRIAKGEHIPQRFLEGILLNLKRHGIINSTRGKDGGYYLIKSPTTISLLDIIIFMEDGVRTLPCICGEEAPECEFCNKEIECSIKNVFRNIYNYSTDTLRNTTLSNLI